MTDPTALALLRDAERYLSALHGSVARHDNLAANYGCAGCELRGRIAAALPTLPEPADRAASTASLAAGLPLVKGHCPACGTAGLFLGDGGYVTCSLIACPEPDAASTMLLRRMADETPATTADKAAELGLTPADYRAACHQAAVDQIRAAAHGLYAGVGIRVLAALDDEQPAAGARQGGATS